MTWLRRPAPEPLGTHWAQIVHPSTAIPEMHYFVNLSVYPVQYLHDIAQIVYLLSIIPAVSTTKHFFAILRLSIVILALSRTRPTVLLTAL